MKIAYNPLSAAALTTAPDNNDITFDLPGVAIYARGIKFKGTDTTYSVFKKHTSDSGGGYNGLVPVPSYTTTTTRFLREDGTWVIPDKTTSIHWNNIDGKPDVFNPSQHIHTTDDIKSLTNYTKATAIATITTSDLLNTALGKLEYKSDLGVTAYNWYKSITDEDTDEHINKWNEIVDFLNGVTDTTLNGILNNFVNDLEVTGSGNAVTDVSKSNNKITVTKGNSFLPLKGGTLTGHLSLKPTAYIKIQGGYSILGLSDNIYFVGATNHPTNIKSDGTLTHNGAIIWDSNTLTNVSQLTNDANYATTSDLDDILMALDNKADKATTLGGYGITDAYTKSQVDSALGGYLPLSGGTLTGRLHLKGALLSFQNTDGSFNGYLGSFNYNLMWYKDDSWHTIIHGGNIGSQSVASATKLQTARSIWGQSFDGTGDVDGDIIISNGNIINIGTGTYSLSQIRSNESVFFIEARKKTDSSTGINVPIYIGWRGGNYPLAIAESGNVGIGTTSPAQKLDVNGNILIPNYYALMSRKTDGTPINLIYCGNDDVIRIGGALPIKLQGNTTITGNVGIGTDNPQYKLDVNGTARASGFIKSGSSSAYVLTGDGGHKLISDFVLTSSGVPWKGFTERTSGFTWGALKQSNGTHTPIFWLDSVNGGGVAFSDADGQTSMLIDGCFYQKEGAYRVTDVTETVTALGTNGNYLTWTKNGTTNNITVPYATIATKITCSAATSDTDRPLVGTDKSNQIYYTTKATVNWSTGNIIAPTFTGALKGNADTATTASKVANTLTFTAGTFAATSYNGSTAVTVKIPTKVSHLTNDSGFVTGGPYLPLSGGKMSGPIKRTSASSSNAVSVVNFYKGTNASTTYNRDATIGWYNEGGDDSTGALYFVPYAQNSEPWGGSVGLYLSKNSIKFEGNTIYHSGNISKSVVGLGNVQNTAFYKRVATINGTGWNMAGTDNSAAFTIYAPTTAGTSGYVLKSNGSGAPTWLAQSSIAAGSATNADKVDGYHIAVQSSAGTDSSTIYFVI